MLMKKYLCTCYYKWRFPWMASLVFTIERDNVTLNFDSRWFYFEIKMLKEKHKWWVLCYSFDYLFTVMQIPCPSGCHHAWLPPPEHRGDVRQLSGGGRAVGRHGVPGGRSTHRHRYKRQVAICLFLSLYSSISLTFTSHCSISAVDCARY